MEHKDKEKCKPCAFVESIRAKKDEAPSFYLFLLREFVFLFIVIVILTFLMLKAGRILSEKSYRSPKIGKIIQQKNALENEEYDSIKLKNYIGRKGYIEVIDSKGKVLYSSNEKKQNEYNELSVKYIEDVNKDVTYTIYPIYKDNDRGYLVIRYEINESSGDVINSIAVINSKNEILYTNMDFKGEKITSSELEYLMGSADNLQDYGIILQKYKFKTNSNQTRYLLIHYESPFERADRIAARGHLAIISIYIFLVLVTVLLAIIRLGSKMRKPLRQLRIAMNGFANGDREQVDIKQGTKEFNQVVETFNNMEKELKKSEEYRQKMLADISHDLKTPITVIQGYIDAMKDGLIPEKETKKYLDIISQKTSTMVELINSFSDYSRLEHPKFKYEFEEGDICEYFREYVALKYPELTLAGYNVDVDIPEDKVIVNFDKIQFKRVFENIISNAVKYTESGTTIYFSLKQGKDIMKIVIGDDGVGIPDELREIIFEPFVVAENARSNGQGTGLGLSIAKTIVENHKGKIFISDRKVNGKGTFFEVVLPIA
jgi:signal transduction histidine kinase